MSNFNSPTDGRLIRERSIELEVKFLEIILTEKVEQTLISQLAAFHKAQFGALSMSTQLVDIYILNFKKRFNVFRLKFLSSSF